MRLNARDVGPAISGSCFQGENGTLILLSGLNPSV